ncbi:MAG: hypothetical protein CVU87_01860 [Firmicutes bacterium HGW-Firmicutes-12]|nr:MAG: hypothetical protein CVU87_01860 [Firmicutes bacterium HGW-Firmicutes-12]
MPLIPILAWILQAIPECMATASLSMSLSTRNLPWDRIWKIGLSQAVTTYLVRLLDFTPGVHVIVLAATLGVFCIHFGKVEMKRALVFSAITMAILVLGEFFSVYTLTKIGLFNINQMDENIINRIIFGYPHTILLFLIAIMIQKKQINLSFIIKKEM